MVPKRKRRQAGIGFCWGDLTRKWNSRRLREGKVRTSSRDAIQMRYCKMKEVIKKKGKENIAFDRAEMKLK